MENMHLSENPEAILDVKELLIKKDTKLITMPEDKSLVLSTSLSLQVAVLIYEFAFEGSTLFLIRSFLVLRNDVIH